MRATLAATATSGAAAGLPAVFGGILLVEAGVPLPVPADLLVIVAGERAAAGAVPLWLCAALLEVAALLGTVALFAAARGPARAMVERGARRVGVSTARLDGVVARLERGVGAPLVLGRLTPGLRTLTVCAAAFSRRRALSALTLLVIGSTVFLQAHLLLGYALGPVADSLLARARMAVLVVALVLLAGAAAAWLWLRGRRAAERGFAEAACPACLLLAVASRGELPREDPAPAQ